MATKRKKCIDCESKSVEIKYLTEQLDWHKKELNKKMDLIVEISNRKRAGENGEV